MPNMVFTAGTMFLLSSVQNDKSTRDIAQALGKVNDCIHFLAEMAWPIAVVAKDMLRRLRQEWTTSRQANSRAGSPGPQASVSTIAALKDPDSDLFKLVKELGWAPPDMTSSTTTMTMPLPLLELEQGLSSTASDPFATLFNPMPGDSSLGLDNDGESLFKQGIVTSPSDL